LKIKSIGKFRKGNREIDLSSECLHLERQTWLAIDHTARTAGHPPFNGYQN